MKPEDVVLPDEALSERFLAATGPGGQNVNKVATACQLRVDVFKLGLSPDAYNRLKEIAGTRMTAAADWRCATTVCVGTAPTVTRASRSVSARAWS